MPYTISPEGSTLTYNIPLPEGVDTTMKEVKVYVITKSNLAFKNKNGHCFRVGFNGAEAKVINTNKDLNEDHPYDKLYPTVARRIIENKTTLALPTDVKGNLQLEIAPLDPGIVFEKVIVDFGGYRPTYLYGVN